MKKIFLFMLCFLLILSLTIPGVAATTVYPPSDDVSNLPEEYKDLFDIIPNMAWRGEYTELSDVPYMELVWDFTGILLMKLFLKEIITRPELHQDNGIRPEDNPNAPRIPRETIKGVFEESFGPDSFEEVFGDRELIHNFWDNLFYEPSTDCYVYTVYVWGGGDRGGSAHERFVKAEQGEGEVILYLRLLVQEWDGTLYGDWNLTDQENRLLLSETKQESSRLVEAAVDSGILDEYLPVYKHTFKDNGQGGYYWFSSEMVERGAPIPDEIFSQVSIPEEEQPPSQEQSPSQGSTGGNHTILGGNWGSITQPSTETEGPTETETLTPEPSVDSAPLWGVIVGLGAVAVALAVGAGLLIKRYKK